MTKSVQEQLADNQAVNYDQNMALHTLIGNTSHWRNNMKNNAKQRASIVAGRFKILTFLGRFKSRA